MATNNPQRAALGDMLRTLRMRAGKDIPEVEDALGWYAGKASRVETGMRGVVPAEAKQLADIYGVTADERATLVELAKAARKREHPVHIQHYAQAYITFERQAVGIDYYAGELISGLFQTKEYARAILATGSRDLDERLSDRLARQKILTGDHPPEVRMVLGEAALHVQIGGPEVMREQIQHLIDVSRLPNVSIRILPFSAGAHHAFGVGFSVLTVATPTSIKRIYTEGLTDATYVHDPEDVAVYEAAFVDVWNLAASDRDSGTILHRRMT